MVGPHTQSLGRSQTRPPLHSNNTCAITVVRGRDKRTARKKGFVCRKMSEVEEEFTVQQVDDGVFLCREKFYLSSNLANIWVVHGTSCDLVIDTGLGIWNLPKFLRDHHLIGKRPVHAVATHIHFDHSGGLHQFESVAIHENAADAIKHGNQLETAALMLNSQIGLPPYKGWKANDYIVKAVQPTRILHEGDVFDLGNRKLKVLHLPGHSPGSIGLLDEEAKLLFSGDTLYDAGMGSLADFIDWLPHSIITDYVSTCKRLQQLAASGRVVKVCPGHCESFDEKRLQELVGDYIVTARGYYRTVFGAMLGFVFSLIVRLKHDNTTAKRCYFLLFLCLLGLVFLLWSFING